MQLVCCTQALLPLPLCVQSTTECFLFQEAFEQTPSHQDVFGHRGVGFPSPTEILNGDWKLSEAGSLQSCSTCNCGECGANKPYISAMNKRFFMTSYVANIQILKPALTTHHKVMSLCFSQTAHSLFGLLLQLQWPPLLQLWPFLLHRKWEER